MRACPWPTSNVVSASVHAIDDNLGMTARRKVLQDCFVGTVGVANKDRATGLDEVIEPRSQVFVQP